MNFLAHFLLADDSHESRIGSALGDFTNIPNERACEKYGETVGRGVIRHRIVDINTDSHPLFLHSVTLLFPRHRHYAHLIVDILFDYFLSVHWKRFSRVPLDRFIDTCHESLGLVDDSYPPRFRMFADRFVRYDVMRTYKTLDGVQWALTRTAGRLSRVTELHDALPDIKRHFDELERAFLGFFPEIREIAAAR